MVITKVLWLITELRIRAVSLFPSGKLLFAKLSMGNDCYFTNVYVNVSFQSFLSQLLRFRLKKKKKHEISHTSLIMSSLMAM